MDTCLCVIGVASHVCHTCGIAVNGFVCHWWGMAREDLHFRLRIPEDLKKQVEQSAEDNRRSMTAEIISRLVASFQPTVILPERLADRVASYASEYGRTISEEVVRILERQFPEPRSADEKFAEVLSMLAGLRGGADTSSVMSKFSAEVLRTLRDIANGDTPADPDTRLRVSHALESWDEAMHYASLEEYTSNMDPEELERFERTGDDRTIINPVFKEDEK